MRHANADQVVYDSLMPWCRLHWFFSNCCAAYTIQLNLYARQGWKAKQCTRWWRQRKERHTSARGSWTPSCPAYVNFNVKEYDLRTTWSKAATVWRHLQRMMVENSPEYVPRQYYHYWVMRLHQSAMVLSCSRQVPTLFVETCLKLWQNITMTISERHQPVLCMSLIVMVVFYCAFLWLSWW